LIPFFTVYLEPVSYLLFFLFFLIYLKVEPSNKIWAFIIYYFIATLLMTIAAIKAFYNERNIGIYNVFLLFNLTIICYYFFKILIFRFKNIFIGLVYLLGVVYIIIKNLVFKDYGLFDSIGFSSLSAITVLFSLFYYRQILKKIDDTVIYYTLDFWIISALFTYNLGAFLIFLSFYFLTDRIIDSYSDSERDLLTLLWGLHNILLFISSIVLIFGNIWRRFRKK